MFASTALITLVGIVSAGSVAWDGRLNGQATSAFLDDWSWSSQVGPYQYYIHGSGATSDYVALSEDYKNSADTGSKQGIQISIDKTSSWNGQNMMRTELIPQTSAAINEGKVFYHFSMQHTETNPPTQTQEHQVCFFESHFTEMKFGQSGGSNNLLQWYANSESHWNVTFDAGVWHNIAYGIDFDAQTVELYHSTGAKDLTLTSGPVSASTSSNGADWHMGVLRLPASSGSETAKESWNFSGVYIEKGDITKSIAGPGSKAVSESAAAKVATSSTIVTATPAQTTFTAPTTLQTKIQTSPALETSSIPTLEAYSIPSSGAATLLAAVAMNPAPTFSAAARISMTDDSLTTLSTWYAETVPVSRLFGKPSSEAIASNPALIFTATTDSAAQTSTGCEEE